MALARSSRKNFTDPVNPSLCNGTRHSAWLWIISLISCSVLSASALPPQIRIGGIFEDDQNGRAIEAAFRFAVDRINSEGKILPQTLLSYHIHYVPRDNSFVATKRVCSLIRTGLAALFGPQDAMLSAHVQSICSTLEIPHIAARWELEAPSLLLKQSTINLYPSYTVLNQAFADLVDHWQWKSMVILYEDQFGLVKLQALLNTQSETKRDVFIQQVDNHDYREALLSIKEMKKFHIVVDIADENIQHFLRAMLQLQMNDFQYHYVFTSFNMELFDLEDFRHNYVNMTAFRLIKRADKDVNEVAQALARFRARTPIGPQSELGSSETFGLTTAAALMYDAVHVFAKSMASLGNSTEIKFVDLSCDDPKDTPWSDGASFTNALTAANFEGLTGLIRFSNGQRDEFELDILRLAMSKHRERIAVIGTWDPINKTKVSENLMATDGAKGTIVPSRPLKVTTMKEAPYVMEKSAKDQTLVGNDRYYGFCVDLMAQIALKAGFNYTFSLVYDNHYGVPIDENKTSSSSPINNEARNWTGMIGELISKKADLAVAALTITYQREQVIDFTKPFMNLGLSILFKIPRTPPSLFSFMKPLSTQIWMYVLLAYVVVSLELFVIARFSPYEWYNPHPCNVHHDIVENQFTLSNTLWFCIGTLMQQGSDVYPRAVSTRIVGGIWWFFTLIIISSYTANLAAFLTVERMASPIESAEDLARNKDGIKFGVVSGGSSFLFFKEARIKTYKDMWLWMEANQGDAFVLSIPDGVKKVDAGNYAFLMESTMIEYTVANNCTLRQIGGLLDSKGYGIGTPKGSEWRDPISLIILELQETGLMQELKEKFWKGEGNCKKSDRTKDNIALNVDNFGGAFVVLSIGLAVGVLASILEFVWNSKKNAHIDRQSLCSEMAEELRFAVRCRGSRQKPTLRRQCSQCMPTHSTYVPTSLEFAGPEAQNLNGNIGALDYKRNLYLYGNDRSRDGL